MNPFAKLLGRFSRFNKPPAFPTRYPHNTHGLSGTIDRAFASAGLDQQSVAQTVQATITQALAQAGLADAGVATRGFVSNAPANEAVTAWDRSDQPRVNPLPRTPAPTWDGEFLSRSFTNAAGSRAYKLYVPKGHATTSERVPLIVMLHGCTQTPDDFAAGTHMNALADQHGFLVVYPAQAVKDNGSKCWNWFRSEDQVRGRGEPSLIAGIARAVASDYRIDEHRIFVAGLSAGAAMAVVLGATYPDVFAAVGAHSGLPFGVAHDVPSAFAVMKDGGNAGDIFEYANQCRSSDARVDFAVPTIVFHGDADRTVDDRNGLAIVREAVKAATSSAPSLHKTVHQEVTKNGGRSYHRAVYVDNVGRSVVEHWIVQGAGHAWSGGSASGSYTDPSGPDASAEMVRFFLQQPVTGISH